MQVKRSKGSRHRGSSSHSWGHKKKHRGAGHRGGKGLAGTGARGDSKKTSILSKASSILKQISAQKGVSMKSITLGNKYFGKKGFNSIHKKKQNVLSISYIENNYDKLVENGSIVKDTIDTTKDYDKVLGRGKMSKKINLICNEISESAKSRIEEAGGTVKVLKVKKEKSEE